MKKLLKGLSVLGLSTVTSSSLVACENITNDKIDLKTTVTKTNLGAIAMVGQEPTKSELIIAIKAKNPSTANNLTVADFLLKDTPTSTNVTIVGENNYRGQVDLNYTNDKIDLKTTVTKTNLGAIAMVGQEPTKSELIIAIKAKNPSTANNLTVADFLLKDTPTSTNVTIVGENNYRGQVDLNYTKQAVITFQATIYVDEQGNEITSDNHDLSEVKSTTIKQIGFYKNGEAIQAARMPQTVLEVPKQLPKEITSLSHMFRKTTSFNQDISSWDVSNVTDMSGMFDSARKFNQDISNWDVSNVTDMSVIFYGANNFNQNISDWDVSNVTNMTNMFNYATNFNQDISNWNVSGVTNMSSMFNGATNFNQDISKWDVSNVTAMGYMFYGATSFNQDISKWDVSNVTNMNGMFYEAINFNQDVSKWNVSNVTDMSYMFNQVASFNQDISKWDVSKVTDMSYMFYSATNFNQDISKWNVSNVKNMNAIFDYCANFNQDISKWNVSNVTSMSYMFKDTNSFNQNISDWDVSNVTAMAGMFQNAKAFNQNISDWDVSKVTNHDSFSDDSGIKNNDFLPKWKTSKS